MSAITIENDLVHYEVLGRGRPVIFVHGWLGSWRYWIPTMQQLSTKYRTYALDLWGFGDSGKEQSRYGFKEQVQLLNDFMEKLGVAKAALVGHSLGAAICLRFAAMHPDRVPRVALISPPLFDLGGLEDIPVTVRAPAPAPVPTPAPPPAPTRPDITRPDTARPETAETIVRNPFRKPGDTPEDILARLEAKKLLSTQGTPPAQPTPATPSAPALPLGIARPLPKTATQTITQAQKSGNTGALTTPPPARTDAPNPLLRMLNVRPADLLTRFVDRTAPDLDKLMSEVEKSDESAINKSVQSFNGVNLSVELQRLQIPTLLLHGRDDPLLPAPSDDLIMRINRGKPAGHLLPLVEPDLHHFPMLEITAKFNRLLLDFFEAQDLTNVQFKDQWRRTMR